MAFPVSPVDGQKYKRYIYSASIGGWVQNKGREVGEVFTIPGVKKELSIDFPAVCLTDFIGTKNIEAANVPALVLEKRSEKLIYLEGQVGETSVFGGTVSGSVFTLADNTANNDLVAGLAEWFAANGEYTTIDIGGVTYQINDVDASTRAITVTGTPTGTSAEIYPHRIAGSTTTARLWSWVGKTAIGAGTTETLAMMMRRDQMQQITGSAGFRRRSDALRAFLEESGAISQGADGASTNSYSGGASFQPTDTFNFNSANSPNARTGTTTHSPDVSVHWYQWAGTYVA